MSYEIVNAIKEAECQGKVIIDEAMAASKKASDEAKSSTTAIMQEAKVQAIKLKESVVASAGEAVQSEKDKIFSDVQLQMRYLKEKAKDNQQKAVDVIIERIVN